MTAPMLIAAWHDDPRHDARGRDPDEQVVGAGDEPVAGDGERGEEQRGPRACRAARAPRR